MNTLKTLLAVVLVIGLVGFLVGCQTPTPCCIDTGNLVDVTNPIVVIPDELMVIQVRQIVNFDFDKDTLDAEAMEVVEGVAALMEKYPDTDLLLAGHTDKYGSDDYNINLSIRRAEAVAEALVKLGVDEQRLIEVAGFGKQDLISKINRENRRVIILSVE